jgi:cellulose synthase/poly-beta-1,6-N-acetylglucosamine synthase-like glycosyltransferase
MKFNIITVTYGERFKFLIQVLDATVSDINVDKIILVDNASSNKKEINEYIAKVNSNQQKIILVRHTENLGSAGGFKSGILEARKHNCDYVLLLDDDNVPEKGWGEKITGLAKFFINEKVVISLNRYNAVGNNIDFSVPDLYKKNYLRLNIIKEKSKKCFSYCAYQCKCLWRNNASLLSNFRD